MKLKLAVAEKENFIRDKIKEANGQFFGVTFIKKDGTVRVMTCRTGVAKHVKGVGLAYNPKVYGLLPVWEKQTDAGGDETYRMVRVSAVTRLTVGGKEYHFEDIKNDR